LVKYLVEDPSVVNAKLIAPSRELIKKPVFNAQYVNPGVVEINGVAEDANLFRPVVEPLIRLLHFKGLNVRHLGLLRKKLVESKTQKNHLLEKFILEIIIVRSAKNYWKNLIREIIEIAGKEIPVKKACMYVSDSNVPFHLGYSISFF
jgi:hypothetical protein